MKERLKYSSPPGSNGEKEFHDVMRKFLTSTDGIDISSMANGDSLVYSFSTPLIKDWNKDDLAVVAWLQNDNDKSIVQSGINLPTYIIESENNSVGLMELNSALKYTYKIGNDNPDTLNTKLFLENIDKPSDWSVNLEYSGTTYDTLMLSIAPGDTAEFQLNIVTGNEIGTLNLTVKSYEINDSHKAGYSVKFFGFMPKGDILVVDDDGGTQYETYLKIVLDLLDVEYTVISQSYIEPIYGNTPSNVSTIIWNVAWGFPALSDADVDFLNAHLNSGGNLLICGQDIGWDIYNGSSNTKKIRDFYNIMLDADFVDDHAGINHVVGIPADPISDGIDFYLSSIYDKYPESIKSHSGNSRAILKYAGSDKIAALANDAGSFKTVYLGIGLEQIAATTVRELLVQRVLKWFGNISAVDDGNKEANTPIEFKLAQNYPNPFNPSTSIKYTIANIAKTNSVNVKLTVYDILGREVVTLVNEKQSPGNYSVEFNANDLPSGVYIYEIRAGSYMASKKMMLIK